MTTTTTPLKLPRFPWIGQRPFYGWVIVGISTMVQFTFNITGSAFGTYFAPLQKEFGWNRAMLAAPRSVTQVENAVLGPIEGFLVDKYGTGTMVMIGSLLMGAGLILFGLTQSLWMYFLSNIIISLGSGFQGVMVLSVGINHWFRRKRTMANAVMGLAYGLAGMVGIPAIVFIQISMGWRTSAVLTGLLVWAVGLPCSMLLRRSRSPELYGLLPDGDSPIASSSEAAKLHRANEEYDFTLREALHTKTFWLLALGQAAGSLALGVTGTHLFLHLEQGVGLSRTTGAFVWTVASIANIPARLIGGFLGDRLPKNIVAGSTTAMVGASMFILGIATSLPIALIFAVLYGIGMGARTPIMNAMQGDYFGRKSQGIIRGWLAVVSLPFTIAAPVLIGFMADIQGTYLVAFTIISVLGLFGAALVFLATHPKPTLAKGNYVRGK